MKMDRRNFLENSCLVCLGIAVGGVSLNSCSNIKTVNSFENKGYLEIDKSEFIDSQTKEEYSNIIVTSNSLKKPLILFKTGTDNYEAVSLECTHKGVKLDLINNRLECSEHGSVFEKNGTVIKGPAKNNLKRYNIDKTLTIIKIEL
jgi:Rieske Fe-S protein